MPPRLPDISVVRALVPQLSAELHKGQAGRIGVVGGSEEDTNIGPVTDVVDRVTNILPRLHVLVVGPGLSRDVLMQEAAKEIVKKARERDMALVLDADALFMVQNHPETIRNYAKAVLTPNAVEFRRLCEAMNVAVDGSHKGEMTQRLSQALGGVTIVQKGQVDYISNGLVVLECDTQSSLKRVGGQGDVLSGAIATFLAWGKLYADGQQNFSRPATELQPADIILHAAWGACSVTRECSNTGFLQHGRGFLASDMLSHIQYGLRLTLGMEK
ncbi:hypothetical protein DFQ30_009617 [Apophysomyces sp. BC1015]|nr:hypothetical protein DFQ30_009617 [Apophysomyces sp. BC1015]KAG0182205.1 hypothetical protein DFQ29_005260 [Apophysomyces sp. BC1021]